MLSNGGMKFITGKKRYAQWFVVFLAMILPFFVIRFFPNFYHSSDMDDFFRWSQAWNADWRSIYINCERCNYPFLGTLFSGGVMSRLDSGSFARLANRFRYYLAVVDALNILMIWLILKNFQVKDAPLWAGIIGLLPSSWLGSSVWGQIDGAGQFLILLFFLLLIWFKQKKRVINQFFLFAVLAGFLLSLMLLTKQLIYFSIFALGIIFLANTLIFSHKPIVIFLSGVIAFVAFSLPILIVDLSLNLKAPYFSHLQYILATGSSHGDIISYTGFNIWVFFSDNPLSSSHSPLPFIPVTVHSAGIFLFLIVNTFLAFVFARHIYKHSDQFVVVSFLYFALVNLIFNLTLTGTHERYLYHFYPFIIIACLAYLNKSDFFGRSTLAALLTGSLIYGAFLFGYLNGWVRPSSLAALQWMSALHILLFVYLIYITLRQFNSQTFDSPLLP